ncbi:MAG: leucine-rich repeat protein [Ruminococcus sp.]|uniref:leucine-rich repeat protein n=1 Tax=Ruminococcus sp. TaxID=41978 RepID=UPI001B2928D6|nr:leucine-rich repeat protein [Ruminococcus sp.]MBO7475119.1 leucine-rich repeat protein [Ruminococcus sp.]
MKIKKIIAAFTALMLVGGAYPVTDDTSNITTVNAAEETEDTTVEKDGILYEISDGKATLIRFNDRTLTDIVIPDDIDGIPVVGFNKTQFTLVKSMKTIKFGNNITEIPAFSFEGFKELETIELGKGIETIGEYAFRNCDSLKNIIFSDGLKLIKHAAFSECSSLVSVELPDSLEKLEYNAFAYCENLESVNLGNGLEYLDENAFYDSTKLSDISFGDKLRYIGYGAFHDYSISSLVLPESVEELDGCPLVGRGMTPDGKPITVVITNPDCVLLKPEWWKGYTIVCAKDSAVEKFAIENGLTYTNIEDMDQDENDDASEENGALKFAETEGGLMVIGVEKLSEDGSLIIPDEVDGVSVVSIYNSIMGELLINEMKSLKIGNNIKTVPAGLFSNCRALESVELGEAVEIIENGAFYMCSSLANVKFNEGLKTIGNAAFSQCGIKNNLRLPDSLESVEAGAFMHSGDFRWVIAGENLRSIGNAAFSGNTSLIGAELNEGLTELGESAFENCYLMENVNIPSTLTTIEKKTFYNTIIEDFELGENIKSVGENAFHSLYSDDGEERVIEAANGLPEVTVPAKKNKVNIIVMNPECEISKDAFTGGFDGIIAYEGATAEEYCNSLEGKYLYSIGSYSDGKAVRNNVPLMKVSETEGGVCIDKILKTEGDTIFIPSEMYGKPVVKIGNHASAMYAEGISNVRTLILEGNVKEIGYMAFSELPIENIEIGEGLVTIDYNDFMLCKNLKSIKLPDSLETIGEASFKCFINLSDVQFGKGLKTIEHGAFDSCNSLTELTLPDSLETIEFSAFGQCKNLTEVKCGAGLKSIERGAFERCYNLKKVTLNEGLESIGDMAFDSCYLLEEINIPNTVKKIEIGAFYDTSIRKLVLPESIEYIDVIAFEYLPKKDSDTEEVLYSFDTGEKIEEVFIIPKYEGEVSVTILNPECVINGGAFKGEIDNIYGYKGSTADKLCASDYIKYNFVPLDKEETKYLAGDANCDGTVDLADAVIIMQSLANPDKYSLDGTDERHITEQGIENGDVDKTIAGLTSNDALRIQEFPLGKAVEFE